MDNSYKITWIAHGWERIICQQLILKSHASTAYLEGRKENDFLVRRESNHIKEKDRCSA
jgi:hypothetical protein